MDSGRLLQSLDDVRQQLLFNLVSIGTSAGTLPRTLPVVADKQIANHSLVLLVDKKRVAEDAAALDGSVAWENLCIHVAQDHLGGSCVVPRQQAPPHGDLIVQQRTKIGGGEVS